MFQRDKNRGTIAIVGHLICHRFFDRRFMRRNTRVRYCALHGLKLMRPTRAEPKRKTGRLATVVGAADILESI